MRSKVSGTGPHNLWIPSFLISFGQNLKCICMASDLDSLRRNFRSTCMLKMECFSTFGKTARLLLAFLCTDLTEKPDPILLSS